ncbi:MAG: DUF192 domain-containing protein [Pseudomonadota bacterium]
MKATFSHDKPLLFEIAIMKHRLPIFLAFFLFAVPVFAQSVDFGKREPLTIETSAGAFSFLVEIADTTEKRSQGLMFREVMRHDHGMLFDFKETRPVAMWMANTILPLDMVFINPDGTVRRIERNTKPFSRDIVTSGGPVSHVLELNAGTALQINLKEGDRIFHRFFGDAG